jgi:hypothetical protein
MRGMGGHMKKGGGGGRAAATRVPLRSKHRCNAQCAAWRVWASWRSSGGSSSSNLAGAGLLLWVCPAGATCLNKLAQYIKA